MPTTTLATTVLGSSRLLDSGRLRGKRVGIVANPASIVLRVRPESSCRIAKLSQHQAD